jgi:hypothetical protein
VQPATALGVGGAMDVALTPGLGFQWKSVAPFTDTNIGGLQGVNDESRMAPLRIDSAFPIAVPAAPAAPDNRIDLIEVRYNRVLNDPSTRSVFDSALRRFLPQTVNKTLAWGLSAADVGYATSPALSTAPIGYKVGAPSLVPVAPSVTPGYIPLAYVNVDNGTAAIQQYHLADLRRLATPSGLQHLAFDTELTTDGGAGTNTARNVVASSGLRWCALTTTGAPGAGRSRRVVLFVVGGPTTTSRRIQGAMQLYNDDSVAACSELILGGGTVNAATRDVMRGLNAGFALMGPALEVGIGTPYWTVELRARTTTGAAFTAAAQASCSATLGTVQT